MSMSIAFKMELGTTGNLKKRKKDINRMKRKADDDKFQNLDKVNQVWSARKVHSTDTKLWVELSINNVGVTFIQFRNGKTLGPKENLYSGNGRLH